MSDTREGKSRVRLLATTRAAAEAEARAWAKANAHRNAKLLEVRPVRPGEGGYGDYLFLATFKWTEPKAKASKARKK